MEERLIGKDNAELIQAKFRRRPSGRAGCARCRFWFTRLLAMAALALLALGHGQLGAATTLATSPGSYSQLTPFAPVNTPTTTPTPTPLKFSAYYTEWGVYDPDYVPADIPAELVNHLNYAFIEPRDVDSDGYFECAIYDTWAAEQKPMTPVVPGTDTGAGEHRGTLNQLRVLRRNRPNLRILMSVGGATLSSNFSTIASTAAHRQHFARACVAFMDAREFDGIDLDWEFPTQADRNNFTALLQAFRKELDILKERKGGNYPLTIAAPAGSGHIANIDIAAIAPIISWANVMAYAFYGPWESTTGSNAGLCSATGDPHGQSNNGNGAIQQYLAGGMPSGKLVLGASYYGRAFRRLQNNGPNSNFPGRFAPVTPNDYFTGTWGMTSVFDYWDIVDRFSGPFHESTTPTPGVNGYTRYWDGEQSVPFAFRPDAIGPNGQGRWVSYDDPQSLARKVYYARTMNLGGLFGWELSQEGRSSTTETTEWPLSSAIATAIAAPPSPFTCASAATATPTPCPINFSDVQPTQYFYEPVRYLYCRQIISGYGDGTFRPYNYTTRAQLSKIVVLAEGWPLYNPPTPTFSDVPADNPFYLFIETAYKHEVISGYGDGTFRPVNNGTRAQLCKIIVLARGWPLGAPGDPTFIDVPKSYPFYAYVETAYLHQIISGYADGTFRPGGNATRGQICKVVYLAITLETD